MPFTPQNAAFLLVDYQPAQLAAVRSMDHAGGLTVVAVDRNEHALRELPDGVRREVADTTDPSVATPLIDRHDRVMTAHLPGGEPGSVAKAGTAARDVPQMQGDAGRCREIP